MCIISCMHWCSGASARMIYCGHAHTLYLWSLQNKMLQCRERMYVRTRLMGLVSSNY